MYLNDHVLYVHVPTSVKYHILWGEKYVTVCLWCYSSPCVISVWYSSTDVHVIYVLGPRARNVRSCTSGGSHLISVLPTYAEWHTFHALYVRKISCHIKALSHIHWIQEISFSICVDCFKVDHIYCCTLHFIAIVLHASKQTAFMCCFIIYCFTHIQSVVVSCEGN